MITVNGTVNLTDVGAHERVYEDVKVDVRVTFTKGNTFLESVTVAPEEKAFLKSVGSTPQHWIDIIQDEFDNSGDFLLDHIVENLPADQYEKAETYITAYYQGNPMPDAHTGREKIHVALLHDAGCKCSDPLLGWRPGKGPRCRLCNTEAVAPEQLMKQEEVNG